MTSSADDAFDPASVKDGVIVAGAVIILAALAFVNVKFSKPTTVDGRFVLGCYKAKGAPALKISPHEISIIEPSHRSFHYSVEQSKDGYQLDVTPALGLHRTEDGSLAFKAEKGIGYFWPLLSGENRGSRKIQELNDYGGQFSIISWDLQLVTYRRVNGIGECT